MATGITLPPRTQVGSTLALGALIDQVTCRNTGLANSDGNLAFHTRLAPWASTALGLRLGVESFYPTTVYP